MELGELLEGRPLGSNFKHLHTINAAAEGVRRSDLDGVTHTTHIRVSFAPSCGLKQASAAATLTVTVNGGSILQEASKSGGFWDRVVFARRAERVLHVKCAICFSFFLCTNSECRTS